MPALHGCRKQELEADRVGMDLAARACFDPAAGKHVRFRQSQQASRSAGPVQSRHAPLWHGEATWVCCSSSKREPSAFVCPATALDPSPYLQHCLMGCPSLVMARIHAVSSL
jgi:hypothetical protein